MVATRTADHTLLWVCPVVLLVKTCAPLRDLLMKTGASARQTPVLCVVMAPPKSLGVPKGTGMHVSVHPTRQILAAFARELAWSQHHVLHRSTTDGSSEASPFRLANVSVEKTSTCLSKDTYA